MVEQTGSAHDLLVSRKAAWRIHVSGEKPERLVTIATFLNPTYAHICRGQLESLGIPALVAGERLGVKGAPPFEPDAGVKLIVREADAQRALRVLRLPRGQVLWHGGVPGEACPACGSSDFGDANLLSWLLPALSIPFLKRKWRCDECGHEWR